jgi:hypothetical protein
MSYYVLPKINNCIFFECKYQKDECPTPYLSHSLKHYLDDLKTQIHKLCLNENGEHIFSIEELSRTINPYEYIFSKVPDTSLSVSKLKPQSNIFYDLLEIFNTLYLAEQMQNQNSIYTIHFSHNSNSSIECLNLIREFNNDQHLSLKLEDSLNGDEQSILNACKKQSIDFLFFEMEADNYKDINTYTLGMIKMCMHILNYQKKGGLCIMKVDEIIHKPIVDMVYFLCSLYDKVILFKPMVNNVIMSEKYIICKNFHYDMNKELDYIYYREILMNILIHCENLFFSNYSPFFYKSLIKTEIMYLFKIKLEEYNVILGHYQLNAMNQMIQIFKNKNKEEKIETVKKVNIQKCILWCEKYKIPNNKFDKEREKDKVNIFIVRT